MWAENRIYWKSVLTFGIYMNSDSQKIRLGLVVGLEYDCLLGVGSKKKVLVTKLECL